jgi:hypothetical protein
VIRDQNILGNAGRSFTLGQSEFELQKGQIFFTPPKSPDRLWSSHSFLHNVKGFLSRGDNGQGVIFTIHSHLAPRLRMSGALTRQPYMPSAAQTGTTQQRIFFISKDLSATCSETSQDTYRPFMLIVYYR